MNTFLEQPRRGKTREAQITPHKRSAVWGGTPKILNILGLATALAVFMILMAQVRYDRRYNRCLADSERMYRVEDNTDNQGYSHWIHDSDITDYLDSLDEVESVCQLSDLDYNYKLEHPVEGVGSLSNITLYDTLFFDFFGFQCVEGAFSELDDDEEVVVPESLAKKLFPKESPVGKTLSLRDRDRGKDTILHRKVVAVYKDMPANNTFGNPLILIKMPRWEYKVVKVDQDSIQALWDGPGKCHAMVFNIEGQEDSLFANAELYGESSESDPISLSASSYQATGEPEYKDVTLRASCDSTKPAPVMAKRVWKDYRWGSIYCKLKPGTNPDTLAAMLKAKFYTEKMWNSAPSDVRLVAAKDIHFEPDAARSVNPDAVSRFVTNCLSGIAWAVLIIAFLNFANFAIAEAPLRMRRVNTRKVLGESDGGIWWSMAKGYVILSLVAFLIAFLVFLLCTRLPEIPMLTAPVTLSGNLSIILTTLLLSIVVGVVVSIYPARMVTVVSPDVALKGNYGFSKTGRRLRTLFIGLQFFLASVILTCTLYVAVQNRYLKQYDMGYQTHNILNYSSGINFQKTDEFAAALKKLPGVNDVTFASHNILRQGYSIFGRPMWTAEGDSATNAIFNVMSVAPNFLNFFGIKMADGIPFEKCDTADTLRYVIFNKKAQEQYHLQLNWYYNFSDGMMKTQIVGFAHDFHFRPLYDSIQPMALELAGELGMMTGHFFVKYNEGADTAAIVQGIRRTAHDFGDDDELKISTLEQDLERCYAKEAGLSKGMFILCGIAVLLALTGVAGMLLLEMTYRRPELGLRQIFGSSTGQLLARANGKYALVCTVAFLLSVPVSLLLLRQWLKLFVAHAPIAVWIFLLAYVILLALTALVVTVQSALSLRFEPVDTVRNS